MKLHVPSEGVFVVKEIKVHEGELATPDPTKPAVIVVKNDPCIVRIEKLSSAQVSRLAVGETIDVQYPGETEWRQAKITYIDPVAQLSGMRHTIKAELPNTERRATGVEINVKLPAKLADLAPVA